MKSNVASTATAGNVVDDVGDYDSNEAAFKPIREEPSQPIRLHDVSPKSPTGMFLIAAFLAEDSTIESKTADEPFRATLHTAHTHSRVIR